MDERLLDLYNTELRHLRETAAEFGRDFPKIAGRLALDPDGKEICPDPYVERLLEGFAFLAARVHLKLDAEYPRFTQGLIEAVYPDYLCPVPSMAIVRFEPEEQDGSLADGFVIKRGTLLRSQLAKGDRTACTFSTAHDVRLLPVVITEARYFTRDLAELNLPQGMDAGAAIRLRLKATLEKGFNEIRLDPLVVHVRGADELPGQVYEQIFGHKTRLFIRPAGQTRSGVDLPPSCIRRVGFLPDQALLPTAPHSFEGYRLLREYFAFPKRFMFFELCGFGPALAEMAANEIDLVIVLDEPDTRLEAKLDKSCFELFCTPAINLFEKTLDRILLTTRSSEFHVVPDRNRPLDFEVYSVTSVAGYGDGTEPERRFLPFYRARDMDINSLSFYTLNRLPRLFSDRERLTGRRSSYAGTDVFISLVDADLASASTDCRQLGIKALCTNRHLPIQVAKGVGRTDFTMEVSGPVNAIRLLEGPTIPRSSLVLAGQNPERPNVPSGRYAWRLISHLSLNYLSLEDSDQQSGAEALREMLRLYVDPNDRQMLKEVDGIRNVRFQPVVRRVPLPGPITFARGLEITLTLDELAFEGQGVFVLGAVLERFLAKYVSVNAFAEVVIATQQRKEIMRWPIQMGRQPML